MTDIVPVPNWGGVRQLETNEYATGGLNGNMNEQAKSLAGQNMYSRLYAGLPFDPVFTAQVGGFPIGGKAALENGDIVWSTVANNTNNPNTNMNGWINPKLEQEKKNNETVSTADYGSVGKAQNIPVSDWYTIGTAYYRGYANLTAVQVDYPHVTSATNTVDWAAAQKACNVQKKHRSIKIIGCLFFKEGEKLQTKEGQCLYGLNNNWFINTNNGTQFTGALTGDIPEYGIYYDGETGSGVRLASASQLKNLHVFGKGYTLTDGSIDILRPALSTMYPTVGVEVEKFAIFEDCSIYYFGTAYDSLAGNYYSRFLNVEITRCSKGFKYTTACYSQHYYGCTIRQVPIPFEFGGKVVTLNYFGGSIEGFLNTSGGCIGIPARSDLNFYGVYMETFEDSIITDSVFKFLGGLSSIKLDHCNLYLNNLSKFVDEGTTKGNQITTNGNRLLVSSATSVKSPIFLSLNPTDTTNLHQIGMDRVEFDALYPNFTTTGSMSSGTKVLTVADSSEIVIGTRLHIVGAGVGGVELETTVTSVSGVNITVDHFAKNTVSGAIVKIYRTPQYVQRSLGIGLANFNLRFPVGYIAQLDNNFDTKFKTIRALTAAPDKAVNGVSSAASLYVADGSIWNPANRASGQGAYVVQLRNGRWVPLLGSFVGSFTMGTTTTKDVLDVNITASSKVFLQATNLAAAALNVAVTSKSNAEKFIVTSTSTPTGTETFDYHFTD